MSREVFVTAPKFKPKIPGIHKLCLRAKSKKVLPQLLGDKLLGMRKRIVFSL